MSALINKIRFYHYISGLLVNQQGDPLCVKCRPFVNTISAMREGVGEVRRIRSNDPVSISEEMSCLLDEAYRRITSITPSEDPVGQKTAGNCKMPEGVCLIKLSKAIMQRL